VRAGKICQLKLSDRDDRLNRMHTFLLLLQNENVIVRLRARQDKRVQCANFHAISNRREPDKPIKKGYSIVTFAAAGSPFGNNFHGTRRGATVCGEFPKNIPPSSPQLRIEHKTPGDSRIRPIPLHKRYILHAAASAGSRAWMRDR